MASPHTRGWTRLQGDGFDRADGFPAHAGMDPMRATMTGRYDGLPRTRGDGPLNVEVEIGRKGASPHTRGWTQGMVQPATPIPGFPAHAGMDPFAR